MSNRLRRLIASGELGGGKTPWYLAGSVPVTNCIGAYQAVGAASLAASYINLVAPGTNDLTTTAAPSWTTEGGWLFTSGKILTSGITWKTSYTVIGLINNAVSTANDQFVFQASTAEVLAMSGPKHYYRNGRLYLAKDGQVTGLSVMAMANNRAYLDGADEGEVPTGALDVTPVNIGNRTEKNRHLNGYILAISFYNVALTQEQIQAIGDAMKTLP